MFGACNTSLRLRSTCNTCVRLQSRVTSSGARVDGLVVFVLLCVFMGDGVILNFFFPWRMGVVTLTAKSTGLLRGRKVFVWTVKSLLGKVIVRFFNLVASREVLNCNLLVWEKLNGWVLELNFDGQNVSELFIHLLNLFLCLFINIFMSEFCKFY